MVKGKIEPVAVLATCTVSSCVLHFPCFTQDLTVVFISHDDKNRVFTFSKISQVCKKQNLPWKIGQITTHFKFFFSWSLKVLWTVLSVVFCGILIFYSKLSEKPLSSLALNFVDILFYCLMYFKLNLNKQ